MGDKRVIVAAGLWAVTVSGALAQGAAPISAIDWLSNSIVTPSAMPANPTFGTARPVVPGSTLSVMPPVPGEPPVSKGVGTEDISVLDLGGPDPNGIGLLPAKRAGLPKALWGKTPETELIDLLRQAQVVNALPAIQQLMQKLMLAELDPPEISDPSRTDSLFLARIDKLLDQGALEPALAMLEQDHSDDPQVFRRRFDVALLLGEEDTACKLMDEMPDVAPSFSARIFCFARNGDWDAAALSLGSGEALGQFDPETATLLERFLEPELGEDADDLPPPTRVTPLNFRMMEAIGQPLPTTGLPLAFAHADLRSNNGWKAQIEAAERLAPHGAIDPNQLLGLYTERRAAASGSLWDRVSAVSALDRAITDNDIDTIETDLPEAYQAMERAELEPVLAELYGPVLAAMDLKGAAKEAAFRLGLLSQDYENVARNADDEAPDDALLIAIALGNTEAVPAQDQLGLALKRVFDAPQTATPAPYRELLPDQLGAAILQAVNDIDNGARGDYPRMVNGLNLLRFVGLETVARRTALEMIILERRG
ncbi:hypothetical protein [Thioclava kandeliae]|uniref:Tetratricopeptide repeat protein n=1 Tax=Thioclava kandeliae TaxID=3070818 RepID=A0ABV1SFK2_9RHOB